MDRITYIMETIEVNKHKAVLMDEFLKDIPTDKLGNFFLFRLDFQEPKTSKELITKNALYAWVRQETQNELRSGNFTFEDPTEMVNFLEKYYRDEALVMGSEPFSKNAVIEMGKDGMLYNRYSLNEYGKKEPLTQKEEYIVFQWIFQNQEKIGDIKRIKVNLKLEKWANTPDKTHPEETFMQDKQDDDIAKESLDAISKLIKGED